MDGRILSLYLYRMKNRRSVESAVSIALTEKIQKHPEFEPTECEYQLPYVEDYAKILRKNWEYYLAKLPANPPQKLAT